MILNILIHALPEHVPIELQREIDKLKRTKRKEECLRKAYKLLSKRFNGRMFYFLTHFPGLFLTNIEKIWNHRKTLNCNVMNYLLRILLVKSGKFRNDDIKNKWTWVKWISPHQYVQVRVDRKKINVDIWGGTRGKRLGTFAH